MNQAKRDEAKRTGPAGKARTVEERRRYQSPRIVKKRAVSSATLFSGSGQASAGIVGNPTP